MLSATEIIQKANSACLFCIIEYITTSTIYFSHGWKVNEQPFNKVENVKREPSADFGPVQSWSGPDIFVLL